MSENNDKIDESITLLDKQISSLQKLKNVNDNIDAKIRNSLITLRNLQIDFIKLQYITEESATSAIDSLHKQTEEIDEYIDLLSDSLKDIDSQI